MAYPDVTSGDIMDRSAVLNNNAAKTVYTYTVQLPYLNTALQELQEYFELNNVPVTDTFSALINVPAGTTSIGFAPAVPVPNTPYLPNNLVEPKLLWERAEGIDPYTPMSRVDFLPRYMDGVELNQFIYYVWQSQEIRVIAANQDNDIKMDYIRFLFAQFTDVTGMETISIINSRTFLEYRTAGLCAEFIGENKTRAESLNNDAGLAMDRVVGIGTKGRQAINIRHRPFRSSYKRRTYM
jgi:hypothetical protein